MAVKEKWVLFFSYLILSTLGLSMGQKVEITETTVQEVTDEFMIEYEKHLDELAASAPDSPDNDLDNEDRGRAFFLLPFLPKLAILLVKVVIKVAPLIIKAAVAIKAKAAVVAAAGIAKVSTAAALKATAITVGKHIIADVAISAAIDVVTDLVAPSKTEEEEEEVEEEEEKPQNIFDYYDNNEECKCEKKKRCECCVQPENFHKGCLKLELTDTLWNDDSNIKVGAFYGNKEIMTRTISVGHPVQRCQMLADPFKTVNMCVSTYGRTKVGNRIIQCFSLFFNNRGLTKCMVQNKNNKLWFQKND